MLAEHGKGPESGCIEPTESVANDSGRAEDEDESAQEKKLCFDSLRVDCVFYVWSK